jgi:hypothetical protein
VIFNKDVAQRYQLLMDQLGISINLNKSIIGDKENNQIEFAKRLSLNGKEMSSIKHNILNKNSEIHLLDLVDLLRERDYISPDADHSALHQVLGSKDLLRLKYLLWLRSPVSAPLIISEGKNTLEITRDDIMQRIVTKRTQNIIDKAMKIKAFDRCSTIATISESFKSIGVPLSETVLNSRSIGDLSPTHPIVLSLTQTSRELNFLMFSVLDDLEPETVSPVEYLPVVSIKSYFSDLSTTKGYLSKILLDCFNEALDEERSKNA